MKEIVQIILDDLPNTQAIYLFGSFATGEITAHSDIDLGVLLPHEEARTADDLRFSETAFKISKQTKRDTDLINLRKASNVFQNQIVSTGKLIFCCDEYAKDVFEMMSLSFYMELNELRALILRDFIESKRAVMV
jgi:predicted nucleotidyltransferase